jgi:hypothetical protein
MSESYPVTVAVTRRDGSVEQVRVGTAIRQGDGFSLKLGELLLGAAEPMRSSSGYGSRSSSSGPAASGDGMVFPPYGRSKGLPIAGATMQDLEFYKSGSLRTLNDPGKARWHDKERVLLAAIEAEIARQGGGSSESSNGSFGGYGGDEPPPPGDEDAPF